MLYPYLPQLQQKSSQPPPPSWSYVGVPYINPVQPYQGNSRQISGLEPLAMLQRYRQGDSALEQSAQLQQIMGESAPSAAPLVGK